jgi:hypothetical protein
MKFHPDQKNNKRDDPDANRLLAQPPHAERNRNECGEKGQHHDHA